MTKEPILSQVTVGLVQYAWSSDLDLNLSKAIEGIGEAAKQGAQVICLPELFQTQYFCQEENPNLFDLAEPVPGPATDGLGVIARNLGVVIVGSVFERRTAGIYHNTAVVLGSDGELLGRYRKMHIPHDPLYYEKYYFTPGDLGVQVIQTEFGRIAPLLCWDQWFPEAARLATLAGAEILVYPTSVGWHPREKKRYGRRQAEAWRITQRAHAITNGVFVAAVNRTGLERPLDGSRSCPANYEGIEFWGGSFVAAPDGRVIARAGQEEEVLVTRINRNDIEYTRRDWPFLRDRRIDAYGGLAERSAL